MGLVLAALAVVFSPMWLIGLCFVFLIVVYFVVDYRGGRAALAKLTGTEGYAKAQRKLRWFAEWIVVGMVLIAVLLIVDRDRFLVVVGTIVGTDTFAQLSGMLVSWLYEKRGWKFLVDLARHPTELSPKKTAGGFLFGFLLGTAAGVGLSWGLCGSIAVVDVVFLAAVSIFSMWGDLSESEAKRELDIKDFAAYLGPHGCLSSRFDSLTRGVIPGAVWVAWRLFVR